MDERIKSQKLFQIWKSVSDKVKNIDPSIIYKVENELTDKNIPCQKGINLLETIDFLHDSKAANSADILPKVFNAYQAFCLSVLKHEQERNDKLGDIFKQCRRLTLNIKLPLSNNIADLKELVSAFKKCISALLKMADKLKPKEKSRHILLADQINTSLELLMKSVAAFEIDEKNSTKKIQTATEYVLGRLLWCVKDTQSDDPADCGQFLQVMDEILDVLEENSPNPDVEKLKNTCQTLLTHAMSVAHVALQQDCQDIFYISQKVLSRVESLSKEESVGLMSLQLGALADNLLQLEQIVNNALLRLVLEVFSDVDASLAKLTKTADNEEDIDKQISDFDLHVDRVMQIGLFAIACSSDVKRVSSVRSCLASIESLEPEFVPSVQALKSGKCDAELVNFFENHWKDEVNRLETLLDQLIDPAAFAQIVANEVTALQSSPTTAPKLVLCASKLRNLISHLDAVELDLSSELIKKFDFYLAELRAALEQPPCEKWERRVLERARLLSKSVQIIAQELVDHSITVESHWSSTQTKGSSDHIVPTKNELISEEESAGQNGIPLKNTSFPESVRELPIDTTETIKGTNIEPIYLAGRIINQERNLMYKTPQHAKTPLSVLRKTPGNIFSHNSSAVAKELFPTDQEEEEKENNGSSELDTTMDLNVTAILENLSGNQDTLSLFAGLEETMCTALEGFKRRRYKIGASLRSRKLDNGDVKNLHKNPPVNSCVSPSMGSQGISIEEREKDLSFLHKKIEDLKIDLEVFGKTIDSCHSELF